MPNIRKLRSGRIPDENPATWVGQIGTIFYNEATGALRISDGTTPGGKNLPFAIASVTEVGGIKAGPGANVSVDGTLTIDTTGLPLSFGNLTAIDTTLKTVTSNSDLVLETNGTGNVELVGNVNFYSAAQGHTGNPYFTAAGDGQVSYFVPASDATAGAVKIIGSLSGRFSPPVNTGVMLHVTGNNDDASRIYNDGIGSFAAFVGRRINGTVAIPSAVQAGDEIIRISSTGHNGTTVPGSGSARIVYQAIENYTPTATGSNISLWTCAVGSNTLSKIVTVDSASGLTATRATIQGNLTVNGNLVGNAITTTATIGTANVATINISAGTATQAPIRYTAGTNLTTPLTGAFEYDGRLFYATPQDSERGLIKTAQVYVLNSDYTLIDQTAVQSMFGVYVAVSSNTRYAYTLNAVVYKSSNNITMAYANDGNATVARHTYQSITTAAAGLATLSTPSVLKNILTNSYTTPVTVTAALNGAGYYSITATGVINVTTGGTWNPLIAFSGQPGPGSYVAAGSTIEIYPIGPGNANVSIGRWT